MKTTQSHSQSLTRRDFLAASATAAAVGSLAAPRRARADATLNVGLIGCGGRGSGAALQALRADPGNRLVAMADLFEDHVENSLLNLSESDVADQVDVPRQRRFVGFDAYQALIDSDVDVVLLATTPHFRPQHLAAAVAADKHVFCEKPVAVDAPGVRSVYETVELARQKKLTLVTGFCYRYSEPDRELFRRIHKGEIGRITAIHATYNTSELWYREPQPGWTEMEHQMRNWLYYTWLSGDHLVEQAIHNVDKMCWAMNGELPVQATALGGRQVRTDPKYGNVYDHFSVAYDYADGVRGLLDCRQQNGCSDQVGDRYFGTRGTAVIDAQRSHEIIRKKKVWRYEPEYNDMYQSEHDALFQAVRSGRPINDGIQMTNSTMMAILGRMAAYTGQTLTWDQALLLRGRRSSRLLFLGTGAPLRGRHARQDRLCLTCTAAIAAPFWRVSPAAPWARPSPSGAWVPPSPGRR